MSLNFRFPERYLSDNDTRQFLLRSHTTKLAVAGLNSNDWPPDLLSLSPHLEVLAFKNLAYYLAPTAPFPEEQITLPVSFRPNHLHVILWYCIIDFGWLQQVIERRPIRMITLYGGSASRDGKTISKEELKHELLQICPVVRIPDYDQQSPIMDWCLPD